jgi:RNA polymerase sigma factor (sigma-70 family)
VRSWFRKDAEEATLPAHAARPDELLDRARDLAHARAALARLSAEERTAFVLHELEDVSIDEIAAALCCSARTVKRRLHSSRARLLSARPPA